ncbi:MAG: protein kinase domain-containing protein, partial [Chthoniobacterales bacterium]
QTMGCEKFKLVIWYSPENKSKISTQDLAKLFHYIKTVDSLKTSGAEASSILALPENSEVTKICDTYDKNIVPSLEERLSLVKNYLNSAFNITTSNNLQGSGKYGSVYPATGPENKNYVLKLETDVKSPIRDIKLANSEKWWRNADFAASRLDLRNMTKVVLVVIEVETNQGKSYFSLPPEKAKEFGKNLDLDLIHPEAKIGVVATLMEQAPGENLEEILEAEQSLDPGGADFRDLLNGCGCYMEDAHYFNVAHLDIKPANVMFAKRRDGSPGTVRIVDFGFSKRGARRYLHENQKTPKLTSKGKDYLSNPCSFTRKWGTTIYMHPSSLKNKFLNNSSIEYRSEVNAYSFGLMLLESINRADFIKVHDTSFKKLGDPRMRQQAWSFLTCEPETYLTRYLNALPPDSETVKKLNNNQDIKELLRLTFQYSGTGSEKDFIAWQNAFHTFQSKHRYEIKTDFSKKK